MIILARKRIKFSQKNSENKEINEQLTAFSHIILDKNILAKTIAN